MNINRTDDTMFQTSKHIKYNSLESFNSILCLSGSPNKNKEEEELIGANFTLNNEYSKQISYDINILHFQNTNHLQLEREYKEIHSNKNINKQSLIGIPKIFYFGRVKGHPFNALIMDMLGPSLEKLFNLCNRKFLLKTVLMIADQCYHV